MRALPTQIFAEKKSRKRKHITYIWLSLTVGWLSSLIIFIDVIRSLVLSILWENSTREIGLLITYCTLGIFLFLGALISTYLWNRAYQELLWAYKVSNGKQLALVKRYKVTSYDRAKEIHRSGFEDWESLQEAKTVGARTVEELRLVQLYNAPDYETAKIIKKGWFNDYQEYQLAQKAGASTQEKLQMVEYYQVPDFHSAEKKFIQEYSVKAHTILSEKGFLTFDSFFDVPFDFSFELFSKITENIEIQGIQINDWQIFFSNDYFQELLREVSQHYADVPFQVIAEKLQIQQEQIPELLVKAIDAKLVVGRVDRTNNCFIVREIPKPFLQQLISGRVASVEEIEQTYNKTITDSLSLLQQQLTSQQHVLTRNDQLIRIEQIKISCQVCGTSTVSDKLLKCKECDRDLCWDHYAEVNSIGRSFCPYCDGELHFLPTYCEKCSLDYIKILKSSSCENCGYPLTVKPGLDSYYNIVLTNQRKPKKTLVEEEATKESKLKDLDNE